MRARACFCLCGSVGVLLLLFLASSASLSLSFLLLLYIFNLQYGLLATNDRSAIYRTVTVHWPLKCYYLSATKEEQMVHVAACPS